MGTDGCTGKEGGESNSIQNQENICQGGFHPKDEIPLGKLEVNDLTVTVSVIRRAFWFVQNDG